MINQDRIVQVSRTDLVTLYANILTIAGTSLTAVQATNPGEFELTTGSGNLIAAEPVKSFDFGSGVSSATVYFVAGFDFEGFTIQGAAVTPESGSAEVSADAATLYTATLASGKITIAKIGF